MTEVIRRAGGRGKQKPLPQAAGASTLHELELEECRKLNAARSAAAEERVADAHIAGRGDVVNTVRTSRPLLGGAKPHPQSRRSVLRYR